LEEALRRWFNPTLDHGSPGSTSKPSNVVTGLNG